MSCPDGGHFNRFDSRFLKPIKRVLRTLYHRREQVRFLKKVTIWAFS